ncbi:hypothetical protein ACWCOW_38155 [Streptomyces sp. NPDC001939]
MEPPPWADTRPDLADDPIAQTIHAIAVDLVHRGYAPRHELPEQAGYLPPQVVVPVSGTHILNIRIEEQRGGELTCWVNFGPQSWYLDRDDWDGEPIPVNATGPLDAPSIVLAALHAVGLPAEPVR